MVDVVYVAASSHDARLTRICVASLRRFYPRQRIELLVGGPLARGLEAELHRYFDVGTAPLPRAEYGWGFVKLEPLFRPAGERFLVLDSDTVITGPVLELAARRDEDFLVDREEVSEARAKQIYFDPARAGRDGGPVPAPSFLFNSGQWFGRSGLIDRAAFEGLVSWTYPRRLLHRERFMDGDQGILNFVINEQLRLGRIRAATIPLMRWPGHGLSGLDAATVARGGAPPLVVHWAGMKKPRLSEMVGSDLLAHFEGAYYARLPLGRARRALDVGTGLVEARLRRLGRRLGRGARA